MNSRKKSAPSPLPSIKQCHFLFILLIVAVIKILRTNIVHIWPLQSVKNWAASSEGEKRAFLALKQTTNGSLLLLLLKTKFRNVNKFFSTNTPHRFNCFTVKIELNKVNAYQTQTKHRLTIFLLQLRKRYG